VNASFSNHQSLRWLTALAVLYTLYLAQSLIIPILFSGFIALLLSPLVKVLKSFHIPRTISSFVLLAMLVTPLSFLATKLVEPAQKWAQLLPKVSVKLNQHINSISEEFANQKQQAEAEEAAKSAVGKSTKEDEEDSGFSFFGLFSSDKAEPEKPKEEEENTVEKRIKQGGIELAIEWLSSAPMFLAQCFGCLILILFLLIYGPSVFIAIRTFPHIPDKRKFDAIVYEVQKVLSKYIATISVINFFLGAATALAFFLIGIDDPILWGVLVGLLNFVPYVGSLISFAILTLAGSVQFGFTLFAIMPASVFLSINLLESQFVTPMVLGTKMQLNPLVIILWLFFLGWLWGIAGVLLAVPILVCIKLTLERLNILGHWLTFIEAKL
jgi:predicted PurR-regulated permease PerM